MDRSGSALMIIGNGFDLQCRLKSSYEDFCVAAGRCKQSRE